MLPAQIEKKPLWFLCENAENSLTGAGEIMYNMICYRLTRSNTPVARRRGGNCRMPEVRVKENESLDSSAQTAFKRQCQRDSVIAEVRKRDAYEKPSVRRKKKSGSRPQA